MSGAGCFSSRRGKPRTWSGRKGGLAGDGGLGYFGSLRLQAVGGEGFGGLSGARQRVVPGRKPYNEKAFAPHLTECGGKRQLDRRATKSRRWAERSRGHRASQAGKCRGFRSPL